MKKYKNYQKYGDGFSFTVEDELTAYKKAYEYQNAKRVKVEFSPNVRAWVVSVYVK